MNSLMRAWRTVPERTRIRKTYFEPIDHPNIALWLEVDPPSQTMRWRFQFLDMCMCFVIEKAFCLRDTDASTPEELERRSPRTATDPPGYGPSAPPRAGSPCWPPWGAPASGWSRTGGGTRRTNGQDGHMHRFIDSPETPIRSASSTSIPQSSWNVSAYSYGTWYATSECRRNEAARYLVE